MRVGLDYRRALWDQNAGGRYARELVRGFCEHNFAGNLGLFGYGPHARHFSNDELGLSGTNAELVRLRLPDRWRQALMKRLNKGADDLVGGAHVFHQVDPFDLDVRDSTEVVTVLDCQPK